MERGRGKNKKLFAIFGICVIVLLVTSVIMSATGEDDISEAVKEKISTASLPDSVQEYVGDFINQKGISSESINNITEVDFNSLPKEVNIENVDNTNLAIYQIDYKNPASSNNKVFVVTYAVEKLASQGDIIISQDKREFLNFGFDGEMKESGFLKTAVGVEGGLEKGYVMMRSGSITGISTSLELLGGNGNLEIIVYKNGKPIPFGNSFIVENIGMKKDYDVQSKDTITFEAGDVISLYVQASEGISWKDVTTLLEITS
ncbi:MAG: hypothetical protein AABW47_01850 [Nanoarchaeota archaeon]